MKGVKRIEASTGRMKKHRYSPEFKATAVKLASHPGIQVQEVAEALAIHPFMLSRCRKWDTQAILTRQKPGNRAIG